MHFHIRVKEREILYLLKQKSEHTCTGLGATSPGCGALAGSDLGLLAAGCLDVSWRLLALELLFVLI